jgi:hypothetical protein
MTLFDYELALCVKVRDFELVQLDAGNDRLAVVIAAVPNDGFDIRSGDAGE